MSWGAAAFPWVYIRALCACRGVHVVHGGSRVPVGVSALCMPWGAAAFRGGPSQPARLSVGMDIPNFISRVC